METFKLHFDISHPFIPAIGDHIKVVINQGSPPVWAHVEHRGMDMRQGIVILICRVPDGFDRSATAPDFEGEN